MNSLGDSQRKSQTRENLVTSRSLADCEVFQKQM